MTVNYNAYLKRAYEEFRKQEELQEQSDLVLARRYYEGYLPQTLREELGYALLSKDPKDIQSLFGVYDTRIDERASRLSITHLSDVPFLIHPDAPEAPPLDWAMELWEEGEMDAMQHEIFIVTLRDGVAFVLLSPELQDTGKVRIVPRLYERYTSAPVGGENTGMKIHYPDDDKNRPPTAISHRWVETYVNHEGFEDQRQRMTLYKYGYAIQDRETGQIQTFPPQIEKWVMNKEGVWVKFTAEDRDWPILWTHPKTGKPMPFPIIIFRNIMDRREGWKMLGPQIIFDNLITALASTASSVAIPGMVVIGGFPTTDGQPVKEDGSNVWRWGPDMVFGFADRRPSEASITPLKPGDVGQLIEAIKQMITLAAITTGTPSLLADQVGRQQVSGEALRQIDIRPTAEIRQMQAKLGNSVTRMIDAWTKLNNAFGGELKLPEAPPTVYAHWLPADIRDFDTVADPAEKSEEIEPIQLDKDTIEEPEPKTME